MKNKYVYLTVIFILVSSIIAYGRILENSFINFDDTAYITENNHIKSGINLKSIRWAFTSVVSGNWHPLTLISHTLDWSLFGEKASGHHLINLLLHMGSVLILFFFLNRTTKTTWPSFFAAAFFALHPLRVESVAWASERKDVLSIFFGMASIYFYALYTERSKFSSYLFCFALFALSLMAKPMMVTLPFVLLLLDYWPLGRYSGETNFQSKSPDGSGHILWKEKIPFFLLAIVISFVTFWSQEKFGVVVPLEDWPIPGRLFNIVIAYVSYLGKIFWPVDLAVFYPFERPFIVQQIFNNIFFLAVITFLALYYIREKPFLFVGWFWYLGTLIPVIGLVQVASQSMADRYTYFPSIGIAIFLTWGISSLISNKIIKNFILFPAGITVLIVLTFLTWQQCGYWKNSITLFRHTLHVTRNNAQAYNNYGLALFVDGNAYGAIYHYNKSINIQPDALCYFNRGLAYASINQFNQAIDDFTKAIAAKPGYATYYNRGVVYAKIGKDQKGIADFSNALLLNPDYVEAYNNRGNIYGQLGMYQLAINDFNKAIIIRPEFVQAYKNRGLAYSEIGQYQRAVEDFSKAISLKPDYVGAYSSRADAYLKHGYLDAGCRDAHKACALGNCKTLESAKDTGHCR